MGFIEVWFCIIGTIYVLNSVVNTLIKIYEVFDDEDEDDDKNNNEIPDEIKNTLYS